MCTLCRRQFRKGKKKGRLVSLWQSQLSIDVIQSGIFTHRTAFFPPGKKNATVPFAIPWYTVNVEKTSGRHFVLPFGRLSRQHNGTYRFQMCRCSAKQRGPFSVYPVFRNVRGHKTNISGSNVAWVPISNFPIVAINLIMNLLSLVGGFSERNPSLFAFAHGIPRMLFQYSWWLKCSVQVNPGPVWMFVIDVDFLRRSEWLMATSHMENIALGCYFENVQKEPIDCGLSSGKK